jgi:hypothetical protein
MSIRRLRFLTWSVVALLVAAGVVCEFRARQVGLGPLSRGSVADDVVATSPEYTPSREGDLAILNISDGRSQDEMSGPSEGYGTDPYGSDPDNSDLDQPDDYQPDSGEPESKVETPPKTWQKWEKYEAVFGLSWTFANPYDPDEIAVDALITTPSGAIVTQPCFWYVPCRRKLLVRAKVPGANGDQTEQGGDEMVEVISQLTPGLGVWMLRYAPREEGEHSYRLVARAPSDVARSAEVSFTVKGSAGHGYMRVSKRDPRYFEFDDGTFFFPVGQNVGWVNHTGSVNFEQYMVNMSRAGANFARIWLTHFFQGQSLEWSMGQRYYHGLGFYSAEMAWKLDRMLEAAEREGVYLMWCIQHHGQFSTTYNSDWNENPYRKPAKPVPDYMERVLGGPEQVKRFEKRRGFLEQPGDFLSHPRAKRLFKKRMRYTIARYGYSTTISSWELWNEVRLTDGYSSAKTTLWHKEMGDYVKTLDPTRRLLTTSYGSRWDRDAYALPSHDFTQVHIYHVDNAEWMTWLIRSVDEQLRGIGRDRTLSKPILIGEYGLAHNPNYGEVTEDSKWPVDPDGLHVHNSLWIGLFSGSAGTAMNWWWDVYIDKRDLYYHFTGISRYIKGEDLRQGSLRRVDLSGDNGGYYARTPKVAGAALAGTDRAYGWLYENAYTIKHFGPTDAAVSGASIDLSGLEDGLYWVEFWNTVDGVATSRREVTVTHGSVKLRIPDFKGDIAFKLYRGDPQATLDTKTPLHDAWTQKLRALAERFNR